MQAPLFNVDEGYTQRGPIRQFLVTVVLGIPMTLLLTLGLAVYCIYESAKFAISNLRKRKAIYASAAAEQSMALSQERALTESLKRMAAIHADPVSPTRAPVSDVSEASLTAGTKEEMPTQS